MRRDILCVLTLGSACTLTTSTIDTALETALFMEVESGLLKGIAQKHGFLPTRSD